MVVDSDSTSGDAASGADAAKVRGEELFSVFMRHLPALAFIKDIDGRYVFCNEAYRVLLGEEPARRLGKTDLELWPPEVARALLDNDRKVLDSLQPLTVAERLTHPATGRDVHHMVSKFPLLHRGRCIGLGGVAVDITHQVEAEAALRESEQRYRVVAEHTYDWETWLGADGRVLYVSPAFERISGHDCQSLLDTFDFLLRIMHPDDLPRWRKHMEKMRAGAESGVLDYRIIRPDGRERWINHYCQCVYDEDDGPLGVRISCRDITDRKIMEMQLQYEVLHDSLTGLPNRTLLLDRVTQALERSKRRDNYHYAVIFLDLDRFKVINDSMGHSMGDQLLIKVARRLQECVRSLDTVARLSSDEFVVLVEEVSSTREAVRIIRRIRAALQKAYELSGQNVHVSASLGVVLSPAIYERPEDLLRNANIAMHRAKDTGRNRFKVFHSRMLEEAIKQMNLEMDLRRALDNKEFFVLYQPILALPRQTVTGFEALARWNHPERGVVSPAEFIPIAEESGLIIPLGYWILEEACRQMAQWRTLMPGSEDMTIHVNLSAKQLNHSDLVGQVNRILTETGLAPGALKLEITESVLMENPDMAMVLLRRLKALGVKLSIDGFGTGYSSLSYLQRFPVDTLKVDQSFVSRMAVDPGNGEIVKAVIALAHSLGMDVVAEGVELEMQCRLLSDLRCESGQGYLFSRPIDCEKVNALIGEGVHALRRF